MSIAPRKFCLSSRLKRKVGKYLMLRSPKDRDIYVQGEAKIFQEQLENFLALAEEFELSGLTENSDGVGKENPRAQFDNLYDRDLGEDKRRNEVAKIKSEDTKKRGLIPTTKENVNQASFMTPHNRHHERLND